MKLIVTTVGSVMVSVLSSSVVARGFGPMASKHATLRGKIKDWFAWNQNNVS